MEKISNNCALPCVAQVYPSQTFMGASNIVASNIIEEKSISEGEELEGKKIFVGYLCACACKDHVTIKNEIYL